MPIRAIASETASVWLAMRAVRLCRWAESSVACEKERLDAAWCQVADLSANDHHRTGGAAATHLGRKGKLARPRQVENDAAREVTARLEILQEEEPVSYALSQAQRWIRSPSRPVGSPG
jgi:hypothetical protein